MSNATPPDPDPAAEGRGTTGDGRRRKPGGASGASGRSGSSGPSGSASGPRTGPPPPAPDGASGSSGATGAAPDTGAAGGGAPPVPFTQQLGRITIVVLAVLFGVFAVANSQRVDFSWVFGETLAEQRPSGEVTGGVPLIVLLLVAFVAGSVITFLTELYVGRSRRARRATKERAEQDRKQGKQAKPGRKDRKDRKGSDG